MPYQYYKIEKFDGKAFSTEAIRQVKPALERALSAHIKKEPRDYARFFSRLEKYLPELSAIYFDIYASCVTAYPFFLELIIKMAENWAGRRASLKELDERRESAPDWFNSNQMVGAVCYVDLFADNFKGLLKKIPYFKELGVNYLHLMPIFKTLDGDNDGGYAVSDYQQTRPDLGTARELSDLADRFHEEGIVLVADFVFNHTSSEHEWALKAKAGETRFMKYYWIFDDRTEPDQFERHLREIFPDEHPGAFTWFEEIQKWVWTTFHSYQWDLNYHNPEVFMQMADQMLKLSNLGVDVLRLDAVAFIWKELGTVCESLPNAYRLIDAFNLIARIAAPSLLFKSEAIVHPDEVIRYIAPERCQLSYNPLLMALMWEALATRDVRLLSLSMSRRFKLPQGTAWVNYIRCHDDIGWTFSDEDASELGINGAPHRRFLNNFYSGKFPGSFARGLPFQENPRTGDCRISGQMASLTGLEKAIQENDTTEMEFSIRRMSLMFGITICIGGIPLIYLGDEVGTMNDYEFQQDPVRKDDSRWANRCRFDESLYAQRNDPASIAGKIWLNVKKMIDIRKTEDIFQRQAIEVLDAGSKYVFAFQKANQEQRAIILANFSEHETRIPMAALRISPREGWRDLISDATLLSDENVTLSPYQFMVIMERGK